MEVSLLNIEKTLGLVQVRFIAAMLSAIAGVVLFVGSVTFGPQLLAGGCAIFCAVIGLAFRYDNKPKSTEKQTDLSWVFFGLGFIGVILAFNVHLAILWALTGESFVSSWLLTWGNMPHGVEIAIQIRTWAILPGQPPGISDSVYLTTIILVPAGCMLLSQVTKNTLARMGAIFTAFSPAFSAYIMVLLDPEIAGLGWITDLGVFEFLVKPLAGIMVFMGYWLLVLPVLLAGAGVSMIMKQIS